MQKFLFAKVLKPQGIKGEIKVEFFVSDAIFARGLKGFSIDDVEYDVETIRLDGKYGYIKTNQISTRNDAENLRGKQLFVNEEDKPQLECSEFFVSDLENCCVVDEYDDIIGFVESVEKHKSSDVVYILSGGMLKSFPLLQKVIKKIDVKNKKIIVYKNFLEEVLI